MLLDPAGDAHLVLRGRDPSAAPPAFHRLLGGHVEFGEATIDAVVREIREETGAVLRHPRLLGVLENRFGYDGARGHEVAFVYTGELDPPRPVPAAGGWLSDNGVGIWTEWHAVTGGDGSIPLYPLGLERLIDDLIGSAGT